MSQSNRDFLETLAFKDLGNHEYETVHPPERMGNAAEIAYGGFALAVATKAACKSVPTNYRLYTIMGNYLGPALIDRPLRSSVQTIRQTRTFATRKVEVSQKQNDGSFRPCIIALADFQVPEPESLLVYSRAPSREYTHYSKIEDSRVQTQQFVDQGKTTQKLVYAFNTSFGLMSRLFVTRPCPEGIFAQSLNGLLKTLPTTQDALPLTQKSTGDWLRSRVPLPCHAENAANLAFAMDGAISFAPLSFNHMFLDDAGACSSLDFALRIFNNDISMDKWHFREIRTHVGDEGRTYSEGVLWDEEGRCVASMTQQSILRPPKKRVAKGKGKL